MDPLTILPPECSSMILNRLPLADLGRLELVSTSWMEFVHSWISVFGPRTHFPITYRPPSSTDNTPQAVVTEFKRLARQEQALRLGEPVSARRFPKSQRLAIAGNYVAWVPVALSSIHWQRLSGTRTSRISAGRFGKRNRKKTVLNIHVNSKGFLLVRVLLEHKEYDMLPYPMPAMPASFGHVLWSLPERRIVWSLTPPDIDHNELPEDISIGIGTRRTYFVTKSLNNRHAYDLVARALDSPNVLYRTAIPIRIQRMPTGEIVIDPKPIIMPVGGDDLIMLPIAYPSFFPNHNHYQDSLLIIGGADGRLQIIRVFSVPDYRVIPHPNSDSFALVGPVERPSAEKDLTIMPVQTISRLANQRYSWTTLDIVILPPNYYNHFLEIAIHPFTWQGFSNLDTSPGPTALVLGQPDHDICLEVESIVRERWPEVTVNEYHCVVAERPMTLPPKQPSRDARRRRLEIPRGHGFYCAYMIDEGQLIIGSNGKAEGYLVRFTP